MYNVVTVSTTSHTDRAPRLAIARYAMYNCPVVPHAKIQKCSLPRPQHAPPET